MKKMEIWTLKKGHVIRNVFSGEIFRNEANEYFLQKKKENFPIITRCYETYDNDPNNDYHLRSNKICLWNTEVKDWFLPMIEKDIRGWEDDVVGYVLSYVFKIVDVWKELETKDVVEFSFGDADLKVETIFHHGDWDEEGKHEEIHFIKNGKYMSSYGISV